jgi:formylglycine-generating enzyme required for sulfatase activity
MMTHLQSRRVCLSLLTIVSLLTFSGSFATACDAPPSAASKEAYPLWDGKEPIADYAKRVKLPPTRSLNLAGGLKLDLVLIPAGEFVMGEPEATLESEKASLKKGAADRNKPGLMEIPRHPVRLTQPFYMSKFIVTQDQYQAVTGTNPSKLTGKDKPVNMVDWNDAQAFCKLLSDKTKQPVRLPTEAEWEFSCRAGTTTEYYSGDTEADLDRVAWYAGNSKKSLHPVGEKAPNAFGLYDMHGGIGQWCLDRYADANYPTTFIEDPQGPPTGALRAMRGGGWATPAWMCKSGVTFGAEIDDQSRGIGIRLVVTVPAVK